MLLDSHVAYCGRPSRAAASQHGGEPGHRTPPTSSPSAAISSWFELAWLGFSPGTHPTGDSGAVLASAAGRARSHVGITPSVAATTALPVVPRRSGRLVDLRHRDRTRLAAGDCDRRPAITIGHRLVAAPIALAHVPQHHRTARDATPATPVEIAAAARQYVRKAISITHLSAAKPPRRLRPPSPRVTATTTRLR